MKKYLFNIIFLSLLANIFSVFSMEVKKDIYLCEDVIEHGVMPFLSLGSLMKMRKVSKFCKQKVDDFIIKVDLSDFQAQRFVKDLLLDIDKILLLKKRLMEKLIEDDNGRPFLYRDPIFLPVFRETILKKDNIEDVLYKIFVDYLDKIMDKKKVRKNISAWAPFVCSLVVLGIELFTFTNVSSEFLLVSFMTFALLVFGLANRFYEDRDFAIDLKNKKKDRLKKFIYGEYDLEEIIIE